MSGAGSDSVVVNRAPVLTVWAAVVAEASGYSWDAALTMGNWIAGTFAHRKGVSIGLYEEHELTEAERAERKRRADQFATVLGRKIPVRVVDEQTGEVRAVNSEGDLIDPVHVQHYIDRAFKDRLPDVINAMRQLAQAYKSNEALQKASYKAYTEFRPEVAGGAKGWGAKAALSLSKIRQMAIDIAKSQN
ncbi:Uncharacterized protein PBTT_04963 [Plasmodiophora brassicae]|nr:hypothetical protein PBRA_009567 [Plasmodiophora brassicae]